MTKQNKDLLTRRWRGGTGGMPRAVYAVVGDSPTDLDVCIGVMDTPELAEETAEAHNDSLERYLGKRFGQSSLSCGSSTERDSRERS